MPSKETPITTSLPATRTESGANTIYAHKNLGIEITFPTCWFVGGGTTLICGISPIAPSAKKSAVVSVTCTDEFNSRTPLKQHIRDQLAACKRMNLKLDFIEGAELKLNGARAYRFTMTSDRKRSNGRLRYTDYIIPSGNHGYFIATDARYFQYITYAPIITEIVNSFRIIKKRRTKA